MADNKTSIVLTADDKTRAAFDSARRNLDGLTGVAGKLNAVMSTLGVGTIAGAGLLAFAKSGIDAADNLNDLSQQIGISVEKLSGYRLAAEQSGTSLEGMARASQQLAKHIAEGDPLLAKLGITSRDVDGAMTQLADVFAALPDGAEKTALAMKLMGKSGADMIPMLNGGGEALRGMIEAGQKLNPITKEMAENADRFNDEMAKLKITTEGAAVKVGGTLAKAFNDATEAYKKFREEHNLVLSALAALGKGVVSTFEDSNAEKAIKLQEKRYALMERIRAIESSSGSADSKSGAIAHLKNEIRAVGEELDRVFKQDKIKLLTKDQLKAAKMASDGAFAGLLKDSDKKSGAAAKKPALDQIDPFGKQRQQAEAEALRKTVEAQNAAFDAMADMRNDQIAQDEKAAAALGRMREAMIDVIDPIQRYREELDKVDALVEAGLFTPEQAAAARLYWQEQMDAAAGFGKLVQDDAKKTADIGRELGMTFTSAFEDAVLAGKDFQDVLESIGQDITRIFLRKMVTEPLADAVSGLFKGFDFGSIFGGARATGGPVAGGTAYLVGERGPELFVPKNAGDIVPNAAAQGSRAVVINMNVQASDADSFRRSMGQIKADLAFAVGSAQRNM